MMGHYDICAVGHITNDVIADPYGVRRKAFGGAAYYAGLAMQRLGLRVLVISMSARCDAPRFRREFAKHGVELRCAASPRTTSFENHYQSMGARRIQRVSAVARPFKLRDLRDINSSLFHLGPLTSNEIPLECFEEIVRRGARISLDMQGFTRTVSGGAVTVTGWPGQTDFLKHVHFLKANRWEATAAANDTDPVAAARRLAGAGPKEVIVTLAEKGAVLCINREVYEIPAAPVSIARDPTGCGDSFCAGYLFARFRGWSGPEAAKFAAALAALKLAHRGPFTGTCGEVEAALAR